MAHSPEEGEEPRLHADSRRRAITGQADYAHGHWPAEFVDLMLPCLMPTLANRLTEEITVQAEAIDRDPPVTATTASTTRAWA